MTSVSIFTEAEIVAKSGSPRPSSYPSCDWAFLLVCGTGRKQITEYCSAHHRFLKVEILKTRILFWRSTTSLWFHRHLEELVSPTSEILVAAPAFTGPHFIAAQVSSEGRCIAKKWVQMSTRSSQWGGHNFEFYYQSSQYWGLSWCSTMDYKLSPSAAGSAPLRVPCHCNDSPPFSLFSSCCITGCARIRSWNMWADWWQKLALFYLQ